jgi:DNA invertase Pin-like site-specific DNA recombinase
MGFPLKEDKVTSSPESLVSVKSGAGSPSRSIAPSKSRRAVGVVRVSRVGDRDGERFVSPTEQRERIASACERDGLELLDTIEELDVSGGTPLAKRPGLRHAVELVEAQEADVVVVAFFDRLVRSLQVQREIVERIEQAGGGIVAVDVGEVRADTASRWLSSTMLGMVSEYHRRVTAERTQDAKRRAVARGVPPFPNVPPGYRRGANGALEPHPEQAPIVAEAFRRRAEGATVMEVRDYLRGQGIERSFHGTQALLTSRVVLGELRFGDLVNTDSHIPIVDAATWQRVQKMRSPRGRRAKSERLLARLGVLRCGTCGARMVIGSSDQNCPPIGHCRRRVTISANVAEQTIVDAVRELLAGMRGTASVADGLADAERDLERAEQELDAAVRAFQGLDDVEAARERLAELHAVRDRERDRLAQLQAAAAPAVTLSASGDWDDLSLDARRALIAAVILRADVAPGRGGDRISVQAGT